MAMGSHKAINSGNRRRPNGLMLLLVFGTALLGVLVLHKLRERRIFNLLAKEKDRELISLQLLLQKEREYNKGLKRNGEEMKAKIYSLRTQKMELDRKALEMQSTINSLKEEQKTMESALEEKQNEIKMQREEEETSQLTALKESLKQKEAEIEDLKHRLGYPVKVWSESSDDSSKPSVNLTNTLNMAERDRSDRSLSGEKSGNFMDGESSTEVEDRSDQRLGSTNSREMTVEMLQKPQMSQGEGVKNERVVGEKSIDGGLVKKKEYSQEDVFGIGEMKNIANLTEPIVEVAVNVSKLADKGSDVMDGNEHAFTRHRELGKLENSQDEKLEVTKGGGKKLEILDPRIYAGSRSRSKHGHVGRTKGKRWRILAKNRDSEDNRLTSTRTYRLVQDESRSKRESQASNERTGTEKGGVDSMVAKLPKARNTEDAEFLINRDVNTDPNQQVERENIMWKNSKSSPDREVPRNRSVDGESTTISSHAQKQKPEEVWQPEEEEEASGTKRNMSSRNNFEQESKQVKDGNERQMTDDKDMEVGDTQEQETESSNVDFFRESASNLEEDKEDYKEEIDESEF